MDLIATVVLAMVAVIVIAAAVACVKSPRMGLIFFFGFAAMHLTVRALLLESFEIPGFLTSVWQDVLIVSMCIGVLRKKPWQTIRVYPLDIAVFAVLLLVPLAFIKGGIPFLGVYGFRMTYMPVLLYFIARGMDLDDESLTMIKYLLGICMVLALIGIVLNFAALDFRNSLFDRFEIPRHRTFRINRMTSILYDPPVFGGLMALAFLVSLAYATSARLTRKAMATWMVSCLLFLFCAVVSISRGAWVGLAVGTTLICALSWRKGLVVLAVLSVLVCGAVKWAPEATEKIGLVKIGRGVASIPHIAGEGTTRGRIWRGVLGEIRENPLGFGLGRAGHVAKRFKDRYPDIKLSIMSADGWYLKHTIETGVFGMAVFAVFMAVCAASLFLMWRAEEEASPKALVLGVLAAFICYSVQAAASNVWDFFFAAPFVWALLGLLCSTRNMEPNETQVDPAGRIWLSLSVRNKLTAIVLGAVLVLDLVCTVLGRHVL
ncbi:O-antigen ligase family protein [Candidatus Hydrogenedentota bacterium]